MTTPTLPMEEILATSPFPPPTGRVIGHSRQGQEIDGYRLGRGPLRASLIAGCHGDTGRPDDPRLLAFLERISGRAADEVRAEMERSGVRGMPIRDQMRLQLEFLDQALASASTAFWPPKAKDSETA
jgi:hypothetical protein